MVRRRGDARLQPLLEAKGNEASLDEERSRSKRGIGIVEAERDEQAGRQASGDSRRVKETAD